MSTRCSEELSPVCCHLIYASALVRSKRFQELLESLVEELDGECAIVHLPERMMDCSENSGSSRIIPEVEVTECSRF